MFQKNYRPERTGKIRLLVEGWFNIPHSYALVVCNEVLALQRNYGDKLDIYIHEQPYFREHWNDNKKLMYLPKKNKAIEELREWKGEPIDVIYRITYPYNLTNKKYNKYNNKYIPTIVFYTAEFSTLDPSYFVFDKNLKFIDDNFIKSFLESNTYYFKTPSKWSSKGMEKYLSNGSETRETRDDLSVPSRNKVITHGVDTSVFFRDPTYVKKLRKDWGFSQNDTILMSGGALTRNKGIPEVLMLLYLLVIRDKRIDVKLVLKGTGELYPSQQMVEAYFDDLVNNKVVTREATNYLIQNHIKFLPKAVNETSLRYLFNAVDIYVSPYLAEGFNMMVLEAISCGTKVLVSGGGSTDDYINRLLADVKDANKYIFKFDTTVTGSESTKKHLVIDVNKLYNTFKSIDFTERSEEYYNTITSYVCKNLSWNSVSHDFYRYIKEVYESV